MKILKIFGIVVGIHVFALILIFANPGCSSTSKPAPRPTDTAAAPSPAPAPSAASSNVYSSTTDNALTPAPGGFNPDAPALSGAGSSSGMRAAPTRPGTPVASSLVAEPVADVTPATTYTVKAGDNLSTIAKKNHTTVAQLTAANSLANNALLRPGQKLIIPGKPASAPAAATAVGAAGTPKGSTKVETVTRSTESMKHTVRPGETLGSIARHYQVRTGEIAVANNITDPSKINAGMELVIPGWTPAGKTAKNGKNGKAAPTNNTAPASAAASSATTPPASLSGNTPETITPPPAAEPAPSGPPVPVIRLDDPVAPAPRL